MKMSRRFGNDVSSKLPDSILVRAVFCGLSFLAIASTVEGANKTVTLTAIDDSYNLPGREGIYYVVSVSESITLSCNASLSHFASSLTLHWNVSVGNYSSSKGIADYALDKSPKFSRIQSNEQDDTQNNPSFVRVHNLQISENDSFIVCGVPSQEVDNTLDVTSNPIHILVEGSPQCPGNISAKEKDSGYVVTWEGYKGLFPPTYNVVINSTTGYIQESTRNNQYELSSADVMSLTNGTNSSANFPIAVSTCTEAGCSEYCHYRIISPSPDNSTNGTNPDDISDQSQLPSRTVIIIIAVVAAVGLLTVCICAIVSLLICIAMRRKSGTKTPPSGEEIVESCNNASIAIIPEYDTVADVVSKCTDSPPALQQLPKPESNSVAHTPVVDAGYRNVTNSASSHAPRKVRHQNRKTKRAVESNTPVYADPEVLVYTQQQRPREYSLPIRVVSGSNLTDGLLPPPTLSPPPLPLLPPPTLSPPPLPLSPPPKTPPTPLSAFQSRVSVASSNSPSVTDHSNSRLSHVSNQSHRSTRPGMQE